MSDTLEGRNTEAVIRARRHVLGNLISWFQWRHETAATPRGRHKSRVSRDACIWMVGILDELEARGLLEEVEEAAKLRRLRSEVAA